MAVTDFDTKVAVVVREDLAAWQRINVCAFLMSGVVAGAGEPVVGPHYEDGSGRRYLPMLVAVHHGARRRQPGGGAGGAERGARPRRTGAASAAQGGRRRPARPQAASLGTLVGMEPEVLGAGDVTGARTSQPARRIA